MKFSEYSKDISDFLELLLTTSNKVSNFDSFLYYRYRNEDYLPNSPHFDHYNRNKENQLKEIRSRHFKNCCREIIKNTNKIINHVHKLCQASGLDLFSLLSFENLYYLKEIYSFRGSFIKLLAKLSNHKDLEANKEFKKDIERTCGELEKIINKLNALNAEIKKIEGCVQEAVQELEFKMSKRKTETLNLERFSEFKGKINTKILFSILQKVAGETFRMNLKRENSEGKLDAKFGTEKATLIRSETRELTTPYSITQSAIRSTAGDMQQTQRMIEKIKFLLPPEDLIKKFKITNFDEYQQLIKNKTIEALKKVFENNTKFFYGHYGKYFKINLSLFLARYDDFSATQGFVRPSKKILSSKTPIDPKRDFKTVSVIDPHNIEIFISMSLIEECAIKENYEYLESVIIHELTHWFTKHINQNENTLRNLFSEGLARFSEYCTKPELTLEEEFSPDEVSEISFLTNNPRSIEEMENGISRKNRYYIGFYMWLTIYAHISQKKDGRKCFENVINTDLLIKIAYKDEIEYTCTRCGSKSLIKIGYKDEIEYTCTRKRRGFTRKRCGSKSLIKIGYKDEIEYTCTRCGSKSLIKIADKSAAEALYTCRCGSKSLIKIADKVAIEWLRKFRSRMTPKFFFKQYAEATKKMKVPSIFNEEAMKALIEAADEDLAKRKRDIETRKINRNLLKLARHLKQRDMKNAKRKRDKEEFKESLQRLKQRYLENAKRRRTS